MGKRFRKRSFSGQIQYFYILLFLGVFLVCGGAYYLTAHKLVSSSEDSMLEYGLQIAETNMEALLNNMNDNSRMIAYNDVVQETLKSGESLDYEDRLRLQETVTRMAASSAGISSICIFNQEGEVYTAGNIYDVEAIRSRLKDSSFYEKILEGEETEDTAIFSYSTYQDSDRQMVSFLRRVRDLDTLEDLGILVINIPVSSILETFKQVAAQYDMEIAVLDSGGKTIASTDSGKKLADLVTEEKLESGKDSYKAVTFEGKTCKAGLAAGSGGAWSIAGTIPRSRTLAPLKQYTAFFIVCLFAGLALCAFGASVITQRINRPLKNILSSMEQVKQGKLERVSLVETNQEMDDLQIHYNRMLDEIEQLMAQKVEEQRLRRKYELSLLQAQIKPHFLYNTFDSVCALAMMGRTQDVYTMMQALGQYYRKSLHKGQQIIPVKEEIGIVENYLIIQSFRYDDVFEAVYDVDESVKECRTIKLILQPLVENAIYHGFRENDLQGTITIRAKDAGKYVKLVVEDDGIGMTPEKLAEVTRRTEEKQHDRFGLFGTIQRINLYYQQEEKSLVDIQSETGRGTVITVLIPKEMGEQNAEGTGN